MHVGYWGTFVTTPQVAKGLAIVQIKTKVQNEGKGAAMCTLATSILERDGKVIQTAEASQTLPFVGG